VAARERYARLDQRLRQRHQRLRAWHLLGSIALAVAGGVVVVVVVAFDVFRPGKTVCRGPEHVAATPAAHPVVGIAARGLAERFAPIFVFSGGERFFPIPPERFVTLSDLYRRQRGHAAVLEGRAKLPTTACGKDCHQYLDLRNGRVPRHDKARPYRVLQQTKLAHVPAVVGYRVLRYGANPAEFTTQYWLLSLFNSLFGDFHEGDLEEVTVHTQAGGQVRDVFYSEHVAGTVRQWGRGVEAQGARAVAYVAIGSHANYFTTGVQRTLAHCPARHGEEDVICDDLGGVAGDHADGCGEIWTWDGAGKVAAPRSWASCGIVGRGPRVVRYELQPWAGHPVDWGAPKKNIKRKIDWVGDPSTRGQLWTNALAKIRRDACYAIDEE
jgi:hypothetical protein